MSACLSVLQAHVPAWWAEYGVVDSSVDQAESDTIDDNYQPALLGQAKFMAYQAYLAMEAEEKGSAGAAIEEMVQGFSTDVDDNYQLLLLGQLKHIAKPFYDRINERYSTVSADRRDDYDFEVWGIKLTDTIGYRYPWENPSTTDYEMDQNYEFANLGQLKYLFSFDLEEWGIAPVLTVEQPIDEDANLEGIQASEIASTTVTLSGQIDSSNFLNLSINGTVVDSVTEAGPFSFQQALAEEGLNTLVLSLRDQSGNVVSETVEIERLTQAPDLSIESPVSSYSVVTTSNFTISGSVGSSAHLLQLILNEATPLTLIDDGSTDTFSLPTTLLEGENTLEFTVSDRLGNSQSVSRTILFDSQPPQVLQGSATPSQPTYTNSNTFIYSGQLNESGSIQVNGQDVDLSDDGSFSFNQTIDLVEGLNEIEVILTDEYGNTLSEPQTITVYLDITAPTFSVAPAYGSLLKEPMPTIEVTAQDDSGIASVLVNGKSMVDQGDGQQFARAISLDEGVNTITVVVTDQAGNQTTRLLQLELDTVAPQFIAVEPAPNAQQAPLETASRTLLFSGLVDDPTSRVVVENDFNDDVVHATVDTDGAFEFYYNLPATSNRLELTAFDAAGNASSAQTIYVDRLVNFAEITLDQGTDSSITTDRLQLSGTAEPGSTIIVSGARNDFELTAGSNGLFTTSDIIVFANQTTYVVLTAVDPLGNRSSVGHRIISNTTPQATPSAELLSITQDTSATPATFELELLFNNFGALDTSSISVEGMSQPPLSTAFGLFDDITAGPDDIITIEYADLDSNTYTLDIPVDNVSVPTLPIRQGPALPAFTQESELLIYLTMDVDTDYRVTGGLFSSIEGRSGDSSTVAVVVPLMLNAVNDLKFSAVSASGISITLDLGLVTHDSIAPSATAVAFDQSANTITLDFDEPIGQRLASEFSLTQSGLPIEFSLNDPYADQIVLTITDTENYRLDGTPIHLDLPATLSDLAGNRLDGSRAYTFATADSIAPEKPTFVVDRILTNEDTVSVIGTAESGSTVEIFRGAQNVGTATADGEGNFAVTVTLVDGINALTAFATDASGNQSAAFEVGEYVTVERSDTAFVVTSVESAQGNSLVDITNLTTAFTITFNSAIDPSTATNVVLVGDGLGTIPTDPILVVDSSADMQLTLQPSQPLLQGSQYTVRILPSLQDTHGNSLLSNEREFTFRTTLTALDAPKITSVSPNSPTNANSVTIAGTVDSGLDVILLVNGSQSGTDSDGGTSFTFNVSLAPNTENQIEITATDGSITSSPATISIVQDSTAPVVELVTPEGDNNAITLLPTVTFSEAVTNVATSLQITAIDEANSLVVVSGTWRPSSDLRSATFIPSSGNRSLQNGSSYTIDIGSGINDLAGNALDLNTGSSFSFTTVGVPDGLDLLEAPVLDPLGFERTISPSITLRGSAEPGTTLHVLGAARQVSTSVDSNGRFSVLVPLITDAQNDLLAYVESGGAPGLSTGVSVIHSSRQTGVRILSPQQGLEYNNRSVMITGILDNPTEFSKVEVIYQDFTSGSSETVREEASLIGPFFARQIILAPYTVELQTVSDFAEIDNGSGIRKLIVAKNSSESLYFRFIDQGGVESNYDFSSMPDDVADLLAALNRVSDGIDLWNAPELTSQEQSGILNFVSDLSGHIVSEGTQSVTIEATLLSGSVLSASVDFDLYIQPETSDTRPPQVTILYPEQGEIIGEEIVETFIVVEEGTRLNSVDVNGVTAHRELGNFFMIYAMPTQQGINTLTATATDYAGNAGTAEIEVYFDSEPPAQEPTLDTASIDTLEQLISDRVIQLSGMGEAGSIVIIDNGLNTVRTVVKDNGEWSLRVPLLANDTGTLSIYATDDAGNNTEIQSIAYTHDDTKPYVVSTTPGDGDTGVPTNRSLFIEFSEPMDPGFDYTAALALSSRLGQWPEQFNAVISADGRTLEIITDYSFDASDSITVEIASGLPDANGLTTELVYEYSFDTAIYQTTLSGVVLDPEIQALNNIKVGLLGTDIVQYTNTFGTFILDEVPLGEQVLYVDARPDPSTGVPPQGDGRVFGYLEFPVNIQQDADNSLGRPIFLVDTDFSTAVSLEGLSSGPLQLSSAQTDLEGFDIELNGPATFADGTDRGELTVTRIEAAHIPDRLPDGSIPHFLVEIGAPDLTFETPATIHFPNVYDLAEGEEVIVFYFDVGLGNYQELVVSETESYKVGSDGFVEVPALSESGFYGYIPASANYDLTRAFLEGRVVDSSDNGIPNVAVSAVAGGTSVLTDSKGYYTIPLPDVRISRIQTFASVRNPVPNAPDLIYPSAVTDIAVTGITDIPAIVIDQFTLQGNIQFLGETGLLVPNLGELTISDGQVLSISNTAAKEVDLYAYRRFIDGSGNAYYDSQSFMRTTSAYTNESGQLLDDTFQASYQMSFFGSTDESSATAAPKPGDWVKIVAFDSKTGFYGETDVQIPSLGDAPLDINIDLRPPQLELDVNRVFFVDSTRRRANVPHEGIVFTDDEFIEIKTIWRTPDAVPLNRPELSLSARLRVDSIGYRNDYRFNVSGGEHFRILEIREALYSERLAVLQRETDVGIESLVVSRDGSFSAESFIPMEIVSDSYGVAQSTVHSDALNLSTDEYQFYVVDLAVDESGEGELHLTGRIHPSDLSLNIGGETITVGGDGIFDQTINGALTANGLEVGLGSGLERTRYGASYTPVLNGIAPARGSQGDRITLDGEFFSPVAEDNKVAFNGTPASVLSASESQLEVLVPNAASSGEVTVTVAGKVSNGLPFEFISRGINNGSFESLLLKGFTFSGSGEVVEAVGQIDPTHRNRMAFLDTAFDPVGGVSTITSDPFTVPSDTPFLHFDLNVLGTAVFNTMDTYVRVAIAVDDADPVIVANVLPASMQSHVYAALTPYNRGTGFQTVVLNLSDYVDGGSDTPTEVSVQITLYGRGSLPSYLSGMLADDQNPLDVSKAQGTGLLLDNFRLSGSSASALLPPEGDLVVTKPDAAFTVTGGALADRADGEVLVVNQATGEIKTVTASSDGSFTIDLQVDQNDLGHFLINYTTEDTTSDPTESDRKYSPSVKLLIDPANFQ